MHSGRAVLTSVLSALSKLPYCRPAGPGEFTRRAFEAGRLDLTQVEGLRDLIDAETEVQRRVAVGGAGVGICLHCRLETTHGGLRWLQGVQRTRFMALRGMILDCLMYVEGFIDFGEDVDELGQGDMLDNGEYHVSSRHQCPY